jgi:hypothetical protein
MILFTVIMHVPTDGSCKYFKCKILQLCLYLCVSCKHPKCVYIFGGYYILHSLNSYLEPTRGLKVWRQARNPSP